MERRFGPAQALHVDEADMGGLAMLRERLRPEAAAENVHLTFLPFLVKATAVALAAHPSLNARLDPDDGSLEANGSVHVGIPVDTPSGPIIPVIRDVEKRALFDIARAIATLAASARAGTLASEACAGATFSVSNVGSVGGLFTAPLVTPPEVAIVGINRIQDRAIVREDRVIVRPMMYVSVAYDRRAVDGAEAARFTTAFIRSIEDPTALAADPAA